MDEIFNTLVKAGPGWTMFVIIGTSAASLCWYAMNRQYRRMTAEAHAELLKSHDEQLKLKAAANSDLRVRIAELDAEKTSLRERAHALANDVNRLTLEMAELRNRPNVDALVTVIKEIAMEVAEGRDAQTKFNVELLEAVRQLNKDIKKIPVDTVSKVEVVNTPASPVPTTSQP